MNCSVRRPYFIDHLFLTYDICQMPRRKFLQFFPTAAFTNEIFIAWGIEKIVDQMIMLLWINCLPSFQYGLYDDSV